MTKRRTKGGPKRPPRKNSANGNTLEEYQPELIDIELKVASGYVVIIHRPAFHMLQAVIERAQVKYPDPEVPTESVVLDEGTPDETVKEIPLMKDTPEHDAYLKAYSGVAQKRGVYIQDYLFRHRLEVQGYEGVEGHARLVKLHEDDLAELREWGNVDGDRDDYQLVMRHFVVYTLQDHSMISGICGDMTEAMSVNPKEILRLARSFQSPVE